MGRLVTLGHCAHSSVTGEECTGHSFPRIGSAPLALPPCAPLLYQQEHCSGESFVPLDFWRSLFMTSTKTPCAVRPEPFPKQLSGIKSHWAVSYLNQWITDVYLLELDCWPVGRMMMWASFWCCYFCTGIRSRPLVKIWPFSLFSNLIVFRPSLVVIIPPFQCSIQQMSKCRNCGLPHCYVYKVKVAGSVSLA